MTYKVIKKQSSVVMHLNNLKGNATRTCSMGILFSCFLRSKCFVTYILNALVNNSLFKTVLLRFSGIFKLPSSNLFNKLRSEIVCDPILSYTR